MITEEKLIKAGFTKEVKEGVIIYSREGFSFLNNGIAWHPCSILSGDIKIGNIYVETMEDVERFIIESKSI